MVQPSGSDRFGPEALGEGLVVGQMSVQELHRDLAAEHLVVCFPDFGHAAARDQPDELVASGDEVAPVGVRPNGR